MDKTFLNRMFKVDNTPIIMAVITGEILSFFDPIEQKPNLVSKKLIEETPSCIYGMKSMNLTQTAQYMGWTREEVEADSNWNLSPKKEDVEKYKGILENLPRGINIGDEPDVEIGKIK